MNLRTQKRIAAELLNIGRNRVKFIADTAEELKEIKEAITKEDIRNLIKNKKIKAKPEKGISPYRSKKLKTQRRKGRRKGHGSRKGTKTARLSRKKIWMAKVRTQRRFIKSLKEKVAIELKTYRNLYKLVKRNFFRSKRHMKLYLEEHNLFKKK